ncbi:hypothetical protein [Dysgonomonas sp. GY617]|uniref:hypothetical protein n=1 Tax=Dysgonomonas sp. GY617 TaxID=2780420 RepID=UPI00188354B8|nr:hypothetical protein [Dysgonomonas sp. GY617]MBF0577156.1 hypothetical protein [Dysgonomonas sp. GY617]
MKKLLLLMLSSLSLSVWSQVGINTTSPDESSILDISSGNKGMLLPRVDLTSETLDLDGIPGQALGLMVFNIGSTFAGGLYYWDGLAWKSYEGTLGGVPEISELQCASAILEGGSFKAGIPYSGIVRVPYRGGNGRKYGAGTPISATSTWNSGMTIVLQSGKLEEGGGYLTYNITGTPDASSPIGATFPITFPGPGGTILSCDVTVGEQINADISSIAVMEYMVFGTDPNGTKGFYVMINTPDGKYSLRAFLLHSNPSAGTATNNTRQVQYTDIQIRNNSSSPTTIMWNMLGSYGGGTIHGSGNTLTAPSLEWGGGSANTWATQGPTNTRVNWANEGIYQASNNGPEFRYYSWIDTSTSTKTAYILSVMAGSPAGQNTSNASQMKVYLKIDQITAP